MSVEQAPAAGADPPARSLTQETFGGLRWTYGATAATMLMQLGYSAAIARLLDPALFGLLASTQVILRFGSYLAELGLGPALVQKEELTDDDVRTAFTSSVLLGGGLGIGLSALAPAMAPLFESPDVVPVMRAMALTLVLSGFGLTAHNLLRRTLRFRAIATIEVSSYAAGYLLVGLTLAASGAGVWSLVAAILTQMTVSTTATVLAARHPMRPLLRGRHLRSLYSFGGRVSVISMLEYAGQAIIVVLIGRNSGQASLGQYNRASLLIELPLVNLTFGLSNVLFPALSRVQGEVDRVRRAYLGAISTVGAFLLPVAAGVAVAAPQMVELVLGPRWDAAARLLPALAGAAVMGVLTHFGGIVAEALGILNTKLVLQATYVLVLGAALAVIPSDFLLGYALAYLGAEVLRHTAYMVFMGRVLGLSARDQAAAYLPSIASAAVVALAIHGTTTAAAAAPLPVLFALQALTGAVVLGVMVAVGPLRGVRAEMRDRVAGAYGGDGRGAALALRLLSLGDVSRGKG